MNNIFLQELISRYPQLLSVEDEYHTLCRIVENTIFGSQHYYQSRQAVSLIKYYYEE
jgi:hypothetical protein